jgi:hypothetical protein
MMITGLTINTVFLPREAPVAVAALLAAALLIGLIRRSAQPWGPRALRALRRAMLPAFALAGLGYAACADSIWADWVASDVRSFRGLAVDEKLRRLDPELALFAAQAKTIIPRSYELYAPSDGPSAVYGALRAEYLLLPLRKRPGADYIVVLSDREARYDPARHVFTRGSLVVKGVSSALSYPPGMYILRKGP